MECWGALRFSDHHGLSPSDCSLADTAFKRILTRTKTTGRDKRIGELSAARRHKLLAHPSGMDRSRSGLVAKGSALEERFLPSRADESPRALGTIRVSLCRTNCSLPNLCSTARSSCARKFQEDCGKNIVHEHSSQAVLGVSGTPGTVQARVARMLRECQGEALGERELEEDLGAFMMKLRFSEHVAQSQMAKLSRARVFAGKLQADRRQF